MSGGFKKFINLFKSKDTAASRPKSKYSLHNQPDERRIYKNDYPPLRQLILWGWDLQNNPSFLIFYGVHGFARKQYRANVLEEYVTYTHYAVFKGEQGHFPSFESIKILDSNSGKKMFYKKDVPSRFWYSVDDTKALSRFKDLRKQKVSLPYFENWKQENYAQELSTKNFPFEQFRLASSIGEVLELPEELSKYEDSLITLFSNPNIYMRKKCLKELAQSDPPNELYKYLLRVGSTELIAGLFLELGLQKNNILVQEARQFIISDQNRSGERYIDGVKRCAAIYVDMFDEQVKNGRIQGIRRHLPKLDLHLLYINGKQIPDNKRMDGDVYKKLSNQGYLSEYDYEYDNELRKSIQLRREKRYAKSHYSDGVILHINRLKNTIQEAEMYDLADVIGTIAYYLDAPRLTYYFKGNGNSKGLNYFRRYVRRVMDAYAKKDEEKFIEAMKSLFLSYTEDDFLDKFKGNFQYNYFIRHYLYHRFEWRIPENWSERDEWMRNDQLMRSEGRYEFMPELWNRHLETAVDIATGAKIDVIAKAFTYILNDTDNQARLSYAQLIRLSTSHYKPLSEQFMSILEDKLTNDDSFDMDVLMALMQWDHERVRGFALQYMSRMDGFSADALVRVLLLYNVVAWIDLLDEKIQKWNEQEYLHFFHMIIEKSEEFTYHNVVWPKPLKELLERSFNKLADYTIEEKTDLMTKALRVLNGELPDDLREFLTGLIFSMELNELKTILETHGSMASSSDKISAKNQMVMALLAAIQNDRIPTDEQIINILESGTAKLLSRFIETITNLKEQICTRYETILLLIESDIDVLHDLAREAFDGLTGEEQKKMHGIIIDSPVQKAYAYGLEKMKALYEDNGQFIPQDFVIQMLEHPSDEVKNYISDKVKEVIRHPENHNPELFLYYVKTLLYLPNRLRIGKNHVYDALPAFVRKYKDERQVVEHMLLDLGGSNVILDSERALITLAKIKKEDG